MRNYFPDNDHTPSVVYSISQDKSGFIWFSSGRGGVYRFDGKNFIHYTKKDGFTNALIKRIFCDSKGTIWFCPMKDKLYQYSNGRFLKFSDLKTTTFLSDVVESNGKIIISDHQDLIIYKDHSFKKIHTFPTAILSLKTDVNGDIYILTSDGQLNYLKIKENTIEKIQFMNPIRCFYLDRNGNKWFGITNKVIKYNGKTYKEISIPNSKGNAFLRDIFEDYDGSMWFSTTKGLFRYNGVKTETVILSKYEIDNVCGEIFEDLERNLWIGSAGGLNMISKKGPQILDNELTSLKASSFLFQDKKGDLWFLTQKKLLKYNSNCLKEYNFDGFHLLDQYSAGMEDKNGIIWLVADSRILKFDGRKVIKFETNSNFTNYIRKDFPNRYLSAKSIIRDNMGNILVLYENNIIMKFDGNSFSEYYLAKDSSVFCSLLRKEFGKNWFYSGGNYLNVFNGKSFKKINIKSSHEALKLPVVEDDKYLWAIVSENEKNTLVQIDKKQGIVNKFNEKSGMPSGKIYSIIYNVPGDIWFFIHGKGFAKFDINEYKNTEKPVFYEYFYSEGYKDILVGPSFSSKNGEIWVKSYFGWVRFNPHDFEQHEPKAPNAELLSLRLFLGSHNLINNGDSGKVKSQLPDNLDLPYYENYLTFNFSAPVFNNIENVSYSHILEGFDKEWSPLGKSNEVTYTNLPPGRYTFKVKASNENVMVFGKMASYSFTISPPYWKTWWFYLCSFCAFSGLYFSAIKFRAGRIQKKTLEDLVHLKTKQLQEEKERVENINSELEKSRYQLSKINEIQTKWLKELSDSEQSLRELNYNKDEFFSIISHDLKGPFNSIIMYTDKFMEDFSSLTAEQIIEYSSMLNKSVRNTYDHIEKLLDWSRIQTGRIEYNPIRYEIRKQINEIINLHSGNILKKRIDFCNNIYCDIYVHADENMIRSILNNLISNAVKFTQEGGRISINSVILDNEVEISISDNGIGISKYNLDRLFKINYQFTTPGTCNEKGTGLGLILCKELIEKNGGKIYAISTQGKGSSFSFTVPLYRIF